MFTYIDYIINTKIKICQKIKNYPPNNDVIKAPVHAAAICWVGVILNLGSSIDRIKGLSSLGEDSIMFL